MSLYRLTDNPDIVIRTVDGASIPNDLRNVDWRDYQAWLSQGNTPDPFAPPGPSVVISGITFVGLLTNQEFTDIFAATLTDINVARWIENLRMAGSINVSAQAAINAKNYLVSHNLLTQIRADEIFAPR